jgi:predicted deacylase
MRSVVGAGLALMAVWAVGGSGAAALEEDSLEPDPPRATSAAALAPAVSPSPFADLPAPWGAIELVRRTIGPGDKRRLELPAGAGFADGRLEIPVLVVRGTTAGPTLCVTAGVHGDELNGVEIARHVFEHTQPEGLAGTLIALPIINIHGFRRGVRYLPDRRDLNRFFPGRPTGSTASRMAHTVFTEVLRHCGAVVDLHTGSMQRTNLPQIRADLGADGVRALALRFGVDVVLDARGPEGSLRAAAVAAGIPTVLYEAGEPLRFEDAEIARGVEGVRNVMAHLAMIPDPGVARRVPHVFHRSRWARTDAAGIFRSDRRLGDRVAAGEVLGTVTDPITNERQPIRASVPGRLVGMAIPQVVLPGFAVFHIGMEEESED